MARLLRRGLTALALLGVGASIAAPAHALCKFPPDWECDFKNEDTHLWAYQPGLKFLTDDDTDTLVNDAWAAVHGYYAATRALGDGEIRPQIAQMRDAIDAALASAATELVATASNDPLYLKPQSTDLYCNAFWSVAVQADRECATTDELVLDTQRIIELTEVRAAITQIELDPGLYLGEEWGDIAADIGAIRGEFKRAETLGQNLTPDALASEVGRRFEGINEVLAGPKTTQAEWIASRREVSKTIEDTMLDTLEASAELSRQVEDDRGELDTLGDFSRRSVGRMQQTELGNMTDVQAAQEWAKIEEILIQRGNLVGVDMAAEMQKDSMRRAESERTRRPLPNTGTIIGNEVGAILP